MKPLKTGYRRIPPTEGAKFARERWGMRVDNVAVVDGQILARCENVADTKKPHDFAQSFNLIGSGTRIRTLVDGVRVDLP